MTMLKKLILTLTSCCVFLCSCGKTDISDTDMPDGIVNVEVTTEPETNSPQSPTENPTTTTKAPFNFDDFDDLEWTTTTAKTARPYHAQANNDHNYITPARTTSAVSTSKRQTRTTARNTNITPITPTRTTVIHGSGSASAITALTTLTAVSGSDITTTTAKTGSSASTTTTAKSPQRELLEKMTLEEKVCQMFIVAPEQLAGSQNYITECDKNIKKSLEKYPVGGVLISQGNLVSKTQISAMLRNFQSYSNAAAGMGMFTVIQEEGGNMAPAAEKLGIYDPGNMADLGKNGKEDAVYDAGKKLGEELKNLGFNVDIAPVADLGTNSQNGLGDRVFGSDAEIVSKLVAKMTKGLNDSGVSPVLSHFPGIGAYDGKSALIKRSLSQLRKEEFLPFKSGINSGAKFILVSHQKISAISNDTPCDLSWSAVTGLLRNELGFTGVIITDSHQDTAITQNYTSETAAVMAINAGADMILLPADLDKAVKAVCDAVESGEILESRIDESLMRILDAKSEMNLLVK